MQDRAAVTRAALLAAAAELIDEVGVRGAGLNEIITRAGVSKGSLYFHFASKAELMKEIEQHARSVLDDLIQRLSQTHGLLLLDAAEFAAALLARLDRDQVFRAGLRVERERPPQEGGFEDSVGARTAGALRGRVLAETAALRAGINAEATAELLAALVAGLQSLADVDPQWRSAQTLERLWQLLAAVLLPESQRLSVTGRLPAALARGLGPQTGVD